MIGCVRSGLKTGNLDSRAGADVLAFLRTAVGEFGQTIVMVTHDPSAAAHADRVIFLADGEIIDDLPAPTPSAILDRLRPHEPPAAGTEASPVGAIG